MIEEDKALSPVPPQQPPMVSQYLFLDALKLIREGKKLTKLEWNDTSVYVMLHLSEAFKNNVLSIYRNNKFNEWVISEGDMDGDDWVVLPEGN